MSRKYKFHNSAAAYFVSQEKDPETGKEAFELRLWDGRIGRWLTTDPAGQYASPYMGMGNNPLRIVDPDGAKGEDWYFNDETKELEWHNTTGILDGYTWVGSNSVSNEHLIMFSKLLGGDGMIPGSGIIARNYYSITGGLNDGFEQRTKNIAAWFSHPVDRSLKGIGNFADSGKSFFNDYFASDEMDFNVFLGNRVSNRLSNMTLYDWSYAVGYSAPDIAIGSAGGYALSSLKLGSIRIPVYRTFGGGKSRALGESWSLINPRLYGSSYRNFSGLPNWNTSAFQVRGTVELRHIIKIRPAVPFHGNFGRLVPEAVINRFNVTLTHYNGFKINY